MQTEIATTPESLYLDTRIPQQVKDWCFMRNERNVYLCVTDDGINSYVRSGALTFEFDTIGSRHYHLENME